MPTAHMDTIQLIRAWVQEHHPHIKIRWIGRTGLHLSTPVDTTQDPFSLNLTQIHYEQPDHIEIDTHNATDNGWTTAAHTIPIADPNLYTRLNTLLAEKHPPTSA